MMHPKGGEIMSKKKRHFWDDEDLSPILDDLLSTPLQNSPKTSVEKSPFNRLIPTQICSHHRNPLSFFP